MNIKETMHAIHANNVEKGFWDKERNTGEMLMLVVSELAEALEADRKGRFADTASVKELIAEGYSWDDSKLSFKNNFTASIKDTFEDEIADAVIRLFDIAEGMNIDLEFHIEQKMRYNATREKMHGKKY